MAPTPWSTPRVNWAASPGKTIVLTGAMQPARVHSSDAVFNIGCAVIAALMLEPGVYIAMHGQIFDPWKTRKNLSAQRFETIKTP